MFNVFGCREGTFGTLCTCPAPSTLEEQLLISHFTASVCSEGQLGPSRQSPFSQTPSKFITNTLMQSAMWFNEQQASHALHQIPRW